MREFYSNLPRPVQVGIEATGSMQWFVNLMEELGIECLVGHPSEIRATEPRKQKHVRSIHSAPRAWIFTQIVCARYLEMSLGENVREVILRLAEYRSDVPDGV